MTTIRLIDARRGLDRKCEELFQDAKIAEAIYRYLCDGIEECEDVHDSTVEPLTDIEQRIFLAAMGREEKVCKEVDGEWQDTRPYENSLVGICNEITRKVKKALWTN